MAFYPKPKHNLSTETGFGADQVAVNRLQRILTIKLQYPAIGGQPLKTVIVAENIIDVIAGQSVLPSTPRRLDKLGMNKLPSTPRQARRSGSGA